MLVTTTKLITTLLKLNCQIDFYWFKRIIIFAMFVDHPFFSFFPYFILFKRKEENMDINTKKLLTHGQASCIALSMCPTDENRKLAKDIVDASPFDVVYLQDYSPLVPVAIGKDAKSMNPFLYCSYPDTPPPEKISFEEETSMRTIVMF